MKTTAVIRNREKQMQVADRAWRTVLDRFREAYGAEPDLNDDETDRPVLLSMLEQDIRRQVKAQLAQKISSAAQRIKAIDSGPLRVS